MNLEKIKEFAFLAGELRSEGVIGFNIDGNRFHVLREDLIGLDNLEIKHRGNSTYPYEVFYKGEGFTLFSLASNEDIKLFPQFKDFLKQELLDQLATLEEGGQMDEQSTNAV